MVQPNNETHAGWKGFYTFSGVMALLIILVGLLDIVTSLGSSEIQANSAIGITAWFSLFQTDLLSALGNLGLFNILTLSLGIPVYLALFNIHKHIHPSFAALAAILFFTGTAIYLSSNTMLSMLALSQQYSTAADGQKLLLEAAGRALLARGADLAPGTFIGFLFTQSAGLIMALVLWKGGIFSRVTGWLGAAGFGIMLVFFTLAAFVPAQFNTAVMISAPGGLLLMVYQVLLARKFFQLSTKEGK